MASVPMTLGVRFTAGDGTGLLLLKLNVPWVVFPSGLTAEGIACSYVTLSSGGWRRVDNKNQRPKGKSQISYSLDVIYA